MISKVGIINKKDTHLSVCVFFCYEKVRFEDRMIQLATHSLYDSFLQTVVIPHPVYVKCQINLIWSGFSTKLMTTGDGHDIIRAFSRRCL